MKKKRRLKRSVKFYIVELLFLVLIIFSLIKIIGWHHDNKRNHKILNDLKIYVKIDKNKEENKIDFKGLKSINKNTVAYLIVNGTKVEIPVVKYSNNDYYLNHNFKGEYNISGWVFADYKNKFDGNDKNIVIYGHNTKDGSMFGTLKKVLNKDWYNKDENLNIKLITENEESTYKIFSIYMIKPEDYYITTNFNEGQFLKFLKKIKSRSIHNFKIDLEENDKILTLSTCSSDGTKRVVVHAKKIEKE